MAVGMGREQMRTRTVAILYGTLNMALRLGKKSKEQLLKFNKEAPERNPALDFLMIT